MKHLVLVEDNPDNRLLVRVILDGLYELTEYETGAAAWAGLQQSPPDLVLLDISLPDMDGTELLQKIRADAGLQRLPVVAVTAHAMTGDREKYLGLGFTDYIAKPIVEASELTQAIERALGASLSPTSGA